MPALDPILPVMSGLTYEVAGPDSPVFRWLRSGFPDHKAIQAQFRSTAGTARVLPLAGVALQTQGAAIDWSDPVAQ